MQILLSYPKVHSRMDNPETPLTLNTRRRTNTNSKNNQHKTNNRSNTDPIKSQGWTKVHLKGKDNLETQITLNTRRRTKTSSKNKQHKTNNRSNTDHLKRWWWIKFIARGKDFLFLIRHKSGKCLDKGNNNSYMTGIRTLVVWGIVCQSR